MPQALKVLIVDDDHAEAELLVQELRRAGFEPDWQRVDTEAAYLARLQDGLNLVLSNYHTPQFSGLRALELLQQGGLEVPFILVSRKAGEDTAVSAMKRGAADYLIKNQLARLGESVAHALEANRLRSERKRGQGQLRESERRFREMLENLGLIAVTLDREGGITFCNDFLLRLSGWKREELMGANWFTTFIPGADDETRKLFFDTISAGEVPPHHENSIRTKAGELRHIVWNNTMLRGVSGEVVGTASIGEDATDRKRAEASLRASEDRFRQVVENIREVFWMTDLKEDTLLYISPGYEAIWGRTCASLYASPSSWHESIYELDRARVIAAATARRVSGKYDEIYRIVRPDGTIRWVRERAFPIKGKTGVVSRLVGVAEDVTEEKKRDEQLLRSQRLESIGMLAAGIAHDFNNILAPISMVAPLLRTPTSTAGDLRLLDTLEKCALRGAGLVRQILGFVHGIGGEPRLVQAKHLINDIIGVITQTFPKSILLRSEVPNDLWPILANPTQVHQVLLNLCVNARDAMPDGGTLRLLAQNVVLDAAAASAIVGAKAGAWLLLHVEDTGTGIPPAALEHIWEPFFTTKSAEKGSGLGLPTVRGIVQTHHGFITLVTRPGSTTFRVYLPAETSVVANLPEVVSPAARTGHDELILLVDDEELIREIGRSILTSAGYRVVTAADGQEGARIFASHAAEIALVITDRDMPCMDGAGLTRAVHAQNPAMKILLISGLTSATQGGGPRVQKFGDAFVAKPFAVETLLCAVEGLLHPAAPPRSGEVAAG
jgi:PAS domain S-box-containing protein